MIRVIPSPAEPGYTLALQTVGPSGHSLQFLMTDSICHSSLPCAVLEKVALTSIKFCIYSCKKEDHV